MALIRCPECAGKVSDQAAACPSCGFPVARGPRPKPGAVKRAPPPAPELEDGERRSPGFWDWISPILLVGGVAAVIFFSQQGDTKRTIYAVVLGTAGLIGTIALILRRPYHGKYGEK